MWARRLERACGRGGVKGGWVGCGIGRNIEMLVLNLYYEKGLLLGLSPPASGTSTGCALRKAAGAERCVSRMITSRARFPRWWAGTMAAGNLLPASGLLLVRRRSVVKGRLAIAIRRGGVVRGAVTAAVAVPIPLMGLASVLNPHVRLLRLHAVQQLQLSLQLHHLVLKPQVLEGDSCEEAFVTSETAETAERRTWKRSYVWKCQLTCPDGAQTVVA